MADVVYDLLAKISVDSSELPSGLNNAKRIITGSGVPESTRQLGRAATAAFDKAARAVIGFGTNAIRVGMDFDAAMSRVQAVSGANAEQMAELRNEALLMGRTTKFTQTEAAEALNYMAMAGWKAEQMTAGLPAIMNLAAASGEDLATTSDIVTDAITAYGLTAEDASHFVDVLAATAANSNTNVGMLGETFKYAAALAGSLGYSVDDTAVAFGLMANSGIKASMAGTALRGFLTRMANPTKQSAEAMEALGISLVDDEGNMYTFLELMENMRAAFSESLIGAPEELVEALADLDQQMEEGKITAEEYDAQMQTLLEEKFGNRAAVMAKLASELGGQRALAGLLAIVNASEEDFNSLTEAIYGSSQAYAKVADGSIIPLNKALEDGAEILATYNGAAEAMSATMLDNLSGDMTIMNSAWMGFQQRFSDLMTPEIRRVIPRITEAIGHLTEKLDDMDLSKLADGLADLAVAAIELIEYLISHSDEVIGFVKAIAGGFIANKGLMWLNNAKNTVSDTVGWLFGSGKATGAAAPAAEAAAGAAAGTGAGGSAWLSSLLGGAGWASVAALPLSILGFGGYGVYDTIHKQNVAVAEAVEEAAQQEYSSLEELRAAEEQLHEQYRAAQLAADQRDEMETWASLGGIDPEDGYRGAEFRAAAAAAKAKWEYVQNLLAQAERDGFESLAEQTDAALSGTVHSAGTFGEDTAESYANGLTLGANSFLVPALLGLTGLISSYLHHSEPDVGPMSHDSTWMPDMMAGFAEDIRAGGPGIEAALNDAFAVRPVVGYQNAGYGYAGGGINVTINVNGYEAQDDEALAQRIGEELRYILSREAVATA